MSNLGARNFKSLGVREDTLKGQWLFALPFLLYLALSPLYLFPSGMPQIADFIILIGIGFSLLSWSSKYTGHIRKVYVMGFLFALYAVFVNLINYVFFPDTRFLLSALYYPFNLCIFIYTVSVIEKCGRPLLRAAAAVIAFTVFLELFWSLFLPQGHWRTLGSFNNPNQLAYWSLLSATIIVMLRRPFTLSALDIVLISILAVLQTLALSKAGLITYSLFLIILFFSPYLKMTHRAVFIFLIITGLLAMSINLWDARSMNDSFIQNAIDRVASIGDEPDDSPAARGYYRLFEFPHYVILGAGEGGFARFDDTHVKELHSGLATMIFSYGIVGASLFLYFLYRVFRQQSLFILLFLGPIILFGVSGQNFRFSHFWVYLAITYAGYNLSKTKPENIHETG